MKNPSSSQSRGTGQTSNPRAAYPRRRRRWPWIVAGTLVVLIVAGALSARPAWRMVKSLRAQRFLQQSEEFIAQEEWTKALERVRSALQLAPEDPKVMRHAAQLYARFPPTAHLALDYYRSLLALPQATRQDREEYAAVALGLGDAAIAAPVLEELLEEPNPSPRVLLLGAQYYGGRRELGRAIELAREAVRRDSSNPTNSWVLANLLSSSRKPIDRIEAVSVLWPFAEKEGPLQSRALAAIIRSPDSPREDRERVEAILEAKSTRTTEEELLLAAVKVSLDPTQLQRIADEVVQRFGHGSIEDAASTAAWLNQHELYNRTLALVLPDVARDDYRLARLRYDALVGLDDLASAYAFIRDEQIKGDPIELELLRCTTALRLKNDAAVDSHLRNLLDLARRHPRQLRAVAEFARRNGRTEIANDAYRILSRNPREAAAAYEALLRTADAEGETWVARGYAKELAKLRKDDDSIRLQIAYYDLLLEENLDQAARVAEELHAARPDEFNRRAVLALAYLRQNLPAKAGALVEGQVVTWRKLPPGIRAVVVAALGANDRLAAVSRLVERIPLAPLKPEELDLIRPYLAGRLADADDSADSSLDSPEKL